MNDARQKRNQAIIRYNKLIVNEQTYILELEQHPNLPHANTSKMHVRICNDRENKHKLLSEYLSVFIYRSS